MSRTYKTRPTWVRENDPTEHRYAHHDHRNGICDLDVPASRHVPGLSTAGRCRWDLEHPGDPWHDGPTPEEVHAAWWGPLRAKERTACRTLAAQYNTVGEIDDDLEPAPEHHRHGVSWYW